MSAGGPSGARTWCPAHRTTAGLLLLAELSGSELDQVYAAERYRDRPAERPHLASLRTELAR
jgi:DNA-binding IclR family transcriptional regulator